MQYLFAKLIIIPGSVQRIGNSAFENIWLGTEDKTIDINEGVKTIGDNCFKEAKNLTIAIPSTVNSIGYDAFDVATAVLIVHPGSYAEAYAIENGITYKFSAENEDLSWLTDD